MSADLRVDCTPVGDGWQCRIVVSEGAESTTHDVGVSRAELARLAAGHREPDTLVAESFRFLLEHEPKESILRRFALSDIGRYFPEFEREIGRRMDAGGAA